MTLLIVELAHRQQQRCIEVLAVCCLQDGTMPQRDKRVAANSLLSKHLLQQLGWFVKGLWAAKQAGRQRTHR